jgi:hypothetical protein
MVGSATKMSTESEGFDPYAVVLADLRAKRDQIDQAIQAIESVRGGGSYAKTNSQLVASEGAPNDAGAFLGISIADAAKKLLTIRKQAMGNADIAAALKQGGLVMSANTDPQNMVGSILTRRFEKVGDIVRVGRGIWGLKEWYPNRSFKTKGAVEVATSEPSELLPPSAPLLDAPQD